jgi:thiol-disulfide isomerase/thioredoxin
MPITIRQMHASVACVALALLSSSMLSAKSVKKVTLRNLNGGKARLADYQGRIVVLNFWATWCGPCKEELPRLGQIASQYADHNVAFLLASIDEQKKEPAVRDYVSEHAIKLPVFTGASVDLLEQLAGVNIVPATLVIDEKGEIVRAINGEAREEDVKEAVDWLLSGRRGDPPSSRVKRY